MDYETTIAFCAQNILMYLCVIAWTDPVLKLVFPLYGHNCVTLFGRLKLGYILQVISSVLKLSFKPWHLRTTRRRPCPILLLAQQF